MTIKVFAERTDFNRSHRVCIVDVNQRGDLAVMHGPLTFVAQHPNTLLPDTISGEGATEFLQSALDAAWELGMRPKGFADTTAQVKAMDAHLQDMRRLVFDTLGKPIVASKPEHF